VSSVDYKKNNHVALLTLSDARGLNTLNSEMMEQLEQAVAVVEKDEDIYCMVLTGAGVKAFAAGADIAEMNAMDEAAIRRYIIDGSKLFRRIELFNVPVIAAVHGYALGGGCELAMSCDIRIVSDGSTFGQPETLLGVIPGWGGTQRMARLVGIGKAKELIFTGRYVKADEAFAMGLVNKVVAKDVLMDEAMLMAETIARRGPVAVRAAKRAINAGAQGNLDSSLTFESEMFFECFETEDRKNAMQAFLEKKTFEAFKNR
jgi:enoyl-CoA hydratase